MTNLLIIRYKKSAVSKVTDYFAGADGLLFCATASEKH